MNILIPHHWLLDHLETNVSPLNIAELLSLSGPSVEKVEEINGDWVYDIEITTNRVDSYSVRGIAREAAVILQQAGFDAQLKTIPIPATFNPVSDNQLPMPVITNDLQLCKRISYIILDQVNRVPTPEWMSKRLTQAGFQIHDAVIDITNYITHDLGYPCHAFDYQKLMATGGSIIISYAIKGQSFTTLDGNTYQASGEEVVFHNQKDEIIDLPSIMGTANTSVDQDTKTILLLLESIDPHKVRLASMNHSIRTTAAQILEKNADPNLIPTVLNLGIKLYQEVCDAKIASPIYDDFPITTVIKPFVAQISKINQQLEVELSIEQIRNILENLGCQTKFNKNNQLEIMPPTYRPDLSHQADIIEEVARIYGYHRLPSRIMPTALPLNPPQDEYFDFERKIRQDLSMLGWQELYTYSMVSLELATQSGYPTTQHLAIKNPLTNDKEIMRRSLMPSLLEALQANPNYADLSVFEIAKIYHPQKNKLPIEELRLAMLSRHPYQRVKGDLETILHKYYTELSKTNILDINDNRTTISPLLAQVGELLVGDRTIGTIAILKTGEIAIDLSFKDFAQVVKKYPNYQPLPKTAQLREDFTFTVSEDQRLGEVITAIKHLTNLIINVELTSIYQNNYTFSIIFHDPKQNLSAQDLEPTRTKLIQQICQKFNAKLVSKAN